MGDYPMWLWISYYHKIKFLPESTTVYRVLEESASHSNDIQKYERFILSTIDITAFLYPQILILHLTEPYFTIPKLLFIMIYTISICIWACIKRPDTIQNSLILVMSPHVCEEESADFHLRFMQLRLEKWLNIKGNKRK